MVGTNSSFNLGLKIFVFLGSFLIVWFLQYLVLDVDEYSAKALTYTVESIIQLRSHDRLNTVEERRNEASNAIHEYVTKTSMELNDENKELHFATINSIDYHVESLFLDRYGSDEQCDTIITGHFVHKLRRKAFGVFQETVVAKLRCEIQPTSTTCIASFNQQSQIFTFIVVSIIILVVFLCFEHFPQTWSHYILSFSDMLDDTLKQVSLLPSDNSTVDSEVCETNYKCSGKSLQDEESTSLMSID